MTVAETQVKKIVSGEASCKFSQLGFNMLLTRLSKCYKSNPSPAVLRDITREINSFLMKFETIMRADFEKIQKL